MNSSEILTVLQSMLDYELSAPESDRHGAMLEHWTMTDKPVSIDTGAIRTLISYYKHKVYEESLSPKDQLVLKRNEYLFNVINH